MTFSFCNKDLDEDDEVDFEEREEEVEEAEEAELVVPPFATVAFNGSCPIDLVILSQDETCVFILLAEQETEWLQ